MNIYVVMCICEIAVHSHIYVCECTFKNKESHVRVILAWSKRRVYDSSRHKWMSGIHIWHDESHTHAHGSYCALRTPSLIPDMHRMHVWHISHSCMTNITLLCEIFFFTFMCDLFMTFMCEICHIHVWQIFHCCVRYITFMCDMYITFMCDIYHIHVWHVLHCCVTFMCDIYHIHVWHISHSCVTCVSHSCMTYITLLCDTQLDSCLYVMSHNSIDVYMLSHIWESCLYVTSHNSTHVYMLRHITRLMSIYYVPQCYVT